MSLCFLLTFKSDEIFVLDFVSFTQGFNGSIFWITLLWNNYSMLGPHYPYNYIFYPHPCWCMTEWWNNAMLSGCWNWQNGLAANWWILEADTCFSFWFICTWLDRSNQVSLPWNFSLYRSMRAGTSSLLFTTVYPELNKCLAYSRHSINIIERINKMNCSN